jgi:taurine dioxygenase
VEAQKALGAHFGELVAHPNDPGLEGHPEVMIIHADESSKRVAGESWHSDVSCDPEPPMGSILRIFTLPEVGGDTLFANMYAAFEALSEPMRSFLEGMTASHDGAPYYRSVNARIGRDDGGRSYPCAEHPVVRTHPVSGRKALFVNRMFTTHIAGLSKGESDALLTFLFQHIERPEFQCRFRWQKNSIAFWDNRCVQHQAIWDYWPAERKGHRVTISAETLRQVLRKAGISWQATKTGKASKDPEFTSKMEHILEVYDCPPSDGRVVCVDEFGPLNPATMARAGLVPDHPGYGPRIPAPAGAAHVRRPGPGLRADVLPIP